MRRPLALGWMLASLLTLAFVLLSCSSQQLNTTTPQPSDNAAPQQTAPQPSNNPSTPAAQYGGNQTGRGFGNLTPEQRQAMIAQRQQAAASACAGLNEGDACTLQGGRRGNITGTCETQAGQLLCGFNMTGRGPGAGFTPDG